MFQVFNLHKYVFPVVMNYYSPIGIIWKCKDFKVDHTLFGGDQPSHVQKLTFHLSALNYWKSLTPQMTVQNSFLNVFWKEKKKTLCHLQNLKTALQGSGPSLVTQPAWSLFLGNQGSDQGQGFARKNKAWEKSICREMTSEDYRCHELGLERLQLYLSSPPPPCLLAGGYFICLISPSSALPSIMPTMSWSSD